MFASTSVIVILEADPLSVSEPDRAKIRLFEAWVFWNANFVPSPDPIAGNVTVMSFDAVLQR